MKFNLNDFIALDVEGLLAVNGGSGCGSSSGSSNPSSDSGSGNSSTVSSTSGGGYSVHDNGNGTVTVTQSNGLHFTYRKSSSGSSSGGSGGGSCSGVAGGKTGYTNSCYGNTTAVSTGNGSGSSSSGNHAGGSCSGVSGGSNVDKPTINEPGYEHQICTEPAKEHCDIIAWNHAVDAGLNPTGKDGVVWDGNNFTVDQLFDEHYAGSAMEFNSDCAGLEGFLFYDWDGADANEEYHYEHIEFCRVSADGQSYSYFNNEGFEIGESYENNISFKNDPNAHARNPSSGGTGHVVFVPLYK